MMTDLKIKCPDHPGYSMIAIEQQTYTTACDLIVDDDGMVEIEMIPAEGVMRQDMSTSVTIAYKCANAECDFVIHPSKLFDVARAFVQGRAQTREMIYAAASDSR